jgi:hypothetical protein
MVQRMAGCGTAPGEYFVLAGRNWLHAGSEPTMAVIDANIELLRQIPLREANVDADLARMDAELKPLQVAAGEDLSRIGDPVVSVHVLAT